MICSIVQAPFFKIKIQLSMSGGRKETTKNLWFAWRRNQAKISLSTLYKEKKIKLQKKSFLRKKGESRTEQKRKERIF